MTSPAAGTAAGTDPAARRADDLRTIVRKIVYNEMDRISKIDEKFQLEQNEIQTIIHEITEEVNDVRSIRSKLNSKLTDYCAEVILSRHGGFEHE